jgi:hypothetical protein
MGRIGLAQIATTRVDHNEACNSPSDLQSEVGLFVGTIFVRWPIFALQWTGAEVSVCALRWALAGWHFETGTKSQRR